MFGAFSIHSQIERAVRGGCKRIHFFIIAFLTVIFLHFCSIALLLDLLELFTIYHDHFLEDFYVHYALRFLLTFVVVDFGNVVVKSLERFHGLLSDVF